MAEVGVKLALVDGADPALPWPCYETTGSAGMDLRANFPVHNREGVLLEPGQRALIPTGLKLEIPQGFEAQIRPRSGLALKSGVSLVNSPGTIDSDYRGEIGVIIINHGAEAFAVSHGDRIAQIVFAPVTQIRWDVAIALTQTHRGDGGFGSTGDS